MSGFNQTETRRSRKLRYCEWCNGPIQIGEEYRHWYGLNDDGGGTIAYDSHPECDEAIERERAALGDPDLMSWGESHRRGMTLEETEAAMLEAGE